MYRETSGNDRVRVDDRDERILYLCGILDFNFISGSILVLKSDSFLIFSNFQKGSISQNKDKKEPVRYKERNKICRLVRQMGVFRETRVLLDLFKSTGYI